ncbi:sulfate transporter [Kaistia sp. 32K]|uniref:SulP family inorganic anion transporter n=1 Tax=Kaistia sp. 32K TaxID=2795690 RepID=UPI001916A473|nr:SulP family inorganic anion transporter [Kaistia sp. 32K]BCP53520.1 sulfate transporter [Kaistia sp. 32K]
MVAASFLAKFSGYKRAWLRPDVLSGLSIAAVGLPSAIAYPAIAGLPPEMGLYSSIVPLLAYALFGSSRQLIVGPDAGTMIVLAAVLASLGPLSATDNVATAAALGLGVGLLCFVASLLRLGFIASFLSRPILIGFMSGIALSILVGQIGRLTGVSIESDGLLRPLIELAGKASLINLPTLVLGVSLFVLLRVFSVALPGFPGPLVAIVVATVISVLFDLPSHGVGVIGSIPARLPTPALPVPTGVDFGDLILGAGAVLLVSFGSGIVTARSFAAKTGEPVDANKELVGFGAANVAAGLFGGIPVTASDSRTAINISMGGKTQLASVVAAVALAFAVAFLTGALQLIPKAALGAILASAAIGLIDIQALKQLWRTSRMEFLFALIGMSGAIGLGVLRGVIVAVAATLLYLLVKGATPRDAVLGRLPGREGFFKLHRHPEARPIPGLAIYLLQGSLLFFNVDYVKRRLEARIAGLPEDTRWFVLDAGAVVQIDSTAAAMLDDIHALLAARGIVFAIAELHTEPRSLLTRSGTLARIGETNFFDSLEDACLAFERGGAAHSVRAGAAGP